jgi:hypothetical protein
LITTQTSASGGVSVSGSSDWTWQASSGDIRVKELKPGQEILIGAYTSNFVGQSGSYESGKELNNTETIAFRTGTGITLGSGGYSEAMGLYAVGAPASVECPEPGDAAAIIVPNATAYCEESGVTASVRGDGVNLQSAGQILQAGTTPDSLDYAVRETGNGVGSAGFASMALIGTPGTYELSYKNQVKETISATGPAFVVQKEVHWTSFINQYDPIVPPEGTG